MGAVITEPVSYGYMTRLFFRVGATAFGGWSTTALLLEKELVATQHITKAHLHGAVAYAQVIPGATQVQIVSNIGYRLKGARGAVLAAACYVTPALMLFLAFSLLYFRYVPHGQIVSHLGGVAAALGGVLFANAYRVSKMHVTHPSMWLLVILAATLKLWLGFSPILIVLVFGLGALALSLWAVRKQRA